MNTLTAHRCWQTKLGGRWRGGGGCGGTKQQSPRSGKL